MSLDSFEIISTLYNTLQDSLKLVRKKEDGKLYTLKSVKNDENSDKKKELFFNELKILLPLTHKNIIWYKEAFYDQETKTLNMVLEYINGGDLSMKIKEAKQRRLLFKEKTIWFIFIQILEGINYLHKKNIIHRDLKTSVIYLTKKGKVKIGGLNMGKNIQDLGMALTQIGTPYFTAPEIWEEKPYDYKCDIWSLGCILYELTTLQVPFLGINMQELYQNIINLKYKPIPNIYSNELKEIIKSLLNKNQIDRPSTTTLLTNKIILKKMKELNNNNNLDPHSCINKDAKHIVDDYNINNKNINKFDTHIIYKKTEKKGYNNKNIEKNLNKKSQQQGYGYSNSNINRRNINMLNNRTNSETNDFKIKNKIKEINIIQNSSSYDENYNCEEKNFVIDFNSMKEQNYARSAINQKLHSILNNNCGKIKNNKNKELVSRNNNYNNNKFNLNLKKVKSQITKFNHNMHYIKQTNSKDGIKMKSQNKIFDNNYNIYITLLSDKNSEKDLNIKNRIIVKKNSSNNKSFNNKNNFDIKSNRIIYRMNDKNKRKYNIKIKPKINFKKISPGIQSEYSYCTKKEKKKISDIDINNIQGINTQNNYLKTDNYFNLKNQFNKNTYNKLINIDNNQNNINSYIYNQNFNNINDKKNKKYIVNKNIIISIPEKLPKNLNNDNYCNNFSNKQIKSMSKGISIEKEKMKYLINNQKGNIKKKEAKHTDIKNKNKINFSSVKVLSINFGCV